MGQIIDISASCEGIHGVPDQINRVNVPDQLHRVNVPDQLHRVNVPDQLHRVNVLEQLHQVQITNENIAFFKNQNVNLAMPLLL